MWSFKLELCSTLMVLFLIQDVYCSGQNSIRATRRKISPDDSEPWTLIETHGLMLSHYPSGPEYLNGSPIISRRDNDVPLFASSLSGLTSSAESFVSWDDELVDELKEAPAHSSTSPSLLSSRDVVTRTGTVHLSRRSSGLDELKIETLISGKLPVFPSSSKMLTHSKRSLEETDPTKLNSKDLQSFLSQKPQDLDIVKGAIIQTKITWYTGHDLLNPYCAQKSGWTPTDNSLVIAVTQEWKMRPKCGEFLELVVVDKHVGQVGTSVIARVVDLCGGCAPQVPHADLSKAAFTRLFDLDVGVVSGLAMRKVPPPKAWNNDLYGPRVL